MTASDSNPTQLRVGSGTGTEIEAWRKAIRDTTFAGYHFEMARAMRKEGNTSAALEALGRAISIRPDMPEALFERIGLLKELERHAEADAELQVAASRNPAFPAEARTRLGERLLDQGDVDEALALFEETLALAPGDANALKGAGMALLCLKRNEEALAAFREAVAADRAVEQDLVQPYVRLASWLLSLSRQEEALPLLQASIGLVPSDMAVRETFGHLLLDLGQLDQAEEVFHAILREDPVNVLALSILGQIFCFKDALADAGLCYERALDLRADFPPCLYGLSLVRQAEGRFDDATALARLASRQEPQAARPHSYRGQTLQALGRLDEALEAHRQALSLAPDDLLARSLYGFLLPAIGRADEALELFEELKAHPVIDRARVSWPYTGTGLALEALGRSEEAMEQFRAATAKAPHTLVFDMRQRPWTVPVLVPALRKLGFVTPWSHA